MEAVVSGKELIRYCAYGWFKDPIVQYFYGPQKEQPKGDCSHSYHISNAQNDQANDK